MSIFAVYRKNHYTITALQGGNACNGCNAVMLREAYNKNRCHGFPQHLS